MTNKETNKVTEKEVLSPGEKRNPASNEYNLIKPSEKKERKSIQQVSEMNHRKMRGNGNYTTPSDKS